MHNIHQYYITDRTQSIVIILLTVTGSKKTPEVLPRVLKRNLDHGSGTLLAHGTHGTHGTHSVVEKTDSCKCHGDTEVVAGLNYEVVTHGTARLSDISGTASVSALDIV